MGYKQHNNPFSRKISSPLKHNVTNAAGETWRHGHRDNGKVVSLEAKNIAGSSKFGERSNRKVKGRTEKDLAMEYANQLADYYNKGAITGGNFLADDFGKSHTYRRGGTKKSKKFLTKLTGLDVYRDMHGRVVVDRGKKRKSIGGTNQYNVQQGEWDSDAKAYKNIPEQQVTPEQIYDMMVEGGGMVSIVDGKIVAGNPNEAKYELSDEDYNKAALSGNKRYNTQIFDSNYAPEGFTSDYDERSNDKTGALTVRELLEQRKQKNNPINRLMSNSPLHSNHEGMDERSNQTFNLQEGYDYDEPVINVTESEWVVDPNDPTRMIRTITTDETITGRRKNLNPGGLGQGQAENWAELKEGICNGTIKGDTSICDDVQTISNTTTEYKPIEVEVEEEDIPPPVIEEEDSGPPPLDLGVGGVSETRGGDFRFHIPDIDLMGGIRKIVDGVVFTNKGRCKAGCATNKNS
ncbi:MAG: hypothetical protein B7C24_09065 [Bacteroidetes bacterium 4572_77]|nr:MAG: hypothetical protein B7C24_09065 [Bacteroidetes bacterium 4572_77]